MYSFSFLINHPFIYSTHSVHCFAASNSTDTAQFSFRLYRCQFELTFRITSYFYFLLGIPDIRTPMQYKINWHFLSSVTSFQKPRLQLYYFHLTNLAWSNSLHKPNESSRKLYLFEKHFQKYEIKIVVGLITKKGLKEPLISIFPLLRTQARAPVTFGKRLKTKCFLK